MNFTFNKKVAVGYKSISQRARVLTEHWVNESVFCPSCGNLQLKKYPNNEPVADFFCSGCFEDYELKSKQGCIGVKILDGAYHTKIERLQSVTNPSLFVLNYSLQSLTVLNFFVVPRHFFVPEIIEKRKPLASTARRAGWVGSNILLHKIPKAGKIFIIKECCIEPKDKVLAEWKRTLFLREEKEVSARGWLLDVMNCIERVGKQEFTLSDMYAFESELSIFYPENKHIKEKIRQQLQFLRNKGYLAFLSPGKYRLK